MAPSFASRVTPSRVLALATIAGWVKLARDTRKHGWEWLVVIICEDHGGTHSDSIIEAKPFLDGIGMPGFISHPGTIYEDVHRALQMSEESGLPYALVLDAEDTTKEASFTPFTSSFEGAYEKNPARHSLLPLFNPYLRNVYLAKMRGDDWASIPVPPLPQIPRDAAPNWKAAIEGYVPLFEIFWKYRGEVVTGDTLCDIKHPICLETMTFPDPVIGVAIEPKTQADVDKLGVALGKLSEEDPTFQVKTDQDSGQVIISGMGELHLEIIVDRLRREFKVECNQGAPQVAYKECITQMVQHREVFKKQSGGRGKFADIIIRIGPADEGVTGLQFVDLVKGGNVPKEYIPAVEKGFKEAMQNGVLAGYNLDSLKVELLDGSYHAVDSDALSFEICAKQAFREACPKAKPILLEPIMAVEVVTPEDYMGDVIGDFNKRRGQIEGMDSKAGARVIKAKVPLSEQFGYVTVLRTITSGRATSTMEFSHYEPVPKNVADEVIAEVAKMKAAANA